MKSKLFLSIALILGISQGILNAQQKNELLARDFWKSQPSVSQIEEKIKQGHSPTELNGSAFDPTAYAILENNQIATIDFLLKQGNDVNKRTHDERTYIFWAALRGNLDLMKHLLRQGARTDVLDHSGTSLLMWCASTGQTNTDIYEFCINNGFDISKEKDRNGRNVALSFSRRMEGFELLDYFISKGVDIHDTNKDGNGLFHFAAQAGNLDILKKLVTDYKVSTATNLNTNENAFHFASYKRVGNDEPSQLPLYKYLKALGLNPGLVSHTGRTALHNIAYYSNDTEVIEYLIKEGADANEVDENGNTALINAALRGSKEKVAILLTHTHDINLTNKEGFSAMTRAIRSNSMEVVELLAAKGAETAIVDKAGYDLGYHLVQGTRNNLKLFDQKMAFLKAQGYKPSSLQKDRSTLLHAAIDRGNMALIRRLVELGVDINAKDSNGQTILHYAAMQAKNDDLLKMLLQEGADKRIKTEFDESAYDLASENELLRANKIDFEFLKTTEQ